MPGTYDRNATRKFDFITTNYGFDNGSTAPFFNYIKIYQMARHEYVCYELVNPIITLWNHNRVDYSSNGVHDFDMKLMYEAVSYSVGQVSTDTVEGFGDSHYDTTPSPLSGQANPGTPTFANSNNLENSAASILNTVITQINTAQNTQQPAGASPVKTLNSVTQTLNGLQGFSFPISK
jgi:hypothetical protein